MVYDGVCNPLSYLNRYFKSFDREGNSAPNYAVSVKCLGVLEKITQKLLTMPGEDGKLKQEIKN
jgi:hypothetical protein